MKNRKIKVNVLKIVIRTQRDPPKAKRPRLWLFSIYKLTDPVDWEAGIDSFQKRNPLNGFSLEFN